MSKTVFSTGSAFVRFIWIYHCKQQMNSIDVFKSFLPVSFIQCVKDISGLQITRIFFFLICDPYEDSDFCKVPLRQKPHPSFYPSESIFILAGANPSR